jgi:predicted DNA binding CopG/RHH family protein
MKDIFELDEYEQEIENEIEDYVPVDEETRKRVESIAEQAKKRKNVNIRISERDLRLVKERAAADGVPYQTLISSILHKYVTDRLVDERDIRRTLELIGSGDKQR